MKIKCRWHGCQETNDNKLELHHIIPKSLGGTDADGRKRLCKKHHDIIHKTIAALIFYKFVPKNKQAECKEYIKAYTQKKLENGGI